MLSALESIGKAGVQEGILPIPPEEEDNLTVDNGLKGKNSEAEEDKTVGIWKKPEPEEEKTAGVWTQQKIDQGGKN